MLSACHGNLRFTILIFCIAMPNEKTYRMYRVFCATPGDLEPERQAFHEVIGQVNEELGMANNALFVPVSILPNLVNTLFFRGAIEENIRACTFFVQVLNGTWGPPARNFQWKYDLAHKLKVLPDSLLQDIAVFFKEHDGQDQEAAVVELKTALHQSSAPNSYYFENISTFKEQLRSQLISWYQSVVMTQTQAS